MGLTHPAPDFVNYTFPIVAVLLLFLTYKVLGSQVLSSNLFILGIYIFIVPVLFFTYGDFIEKRVAEKEIKRFLNNNLQLLKLFPGVEGLISDLTPTTPGNNPADAETKKNNDDLIKYSLIVSGAIMFLFVLFSYLIWRSKRKFSYKRMMIKNGILLTLVVIVEIIFFTLIAGNYRIINDNEVLEELFKSMKEYSNEKCPS